MLESSTPALVDLDGYRNITDLLTRRAALAPDHVAFEVPVDGGGQWRPVTTREFLAEVEALAKGFMAVGVEADDAVAILGPTRYEWAVADLAAWFAGAVVVPIYDSSSPEQVRAIVADADVVLGVGGSSEHAGILRSAFALTDTGAHGAWSMDPSDVGSIADLSARAPEVGAEALERRRARAGHESPATIVYTSGTTGEPKGAILTHRNFLGQVLNIAAAYREIVHEGGNTVIFLPLAHVLARGLQLICLAGGMRIAHLSDPSTVVTTLSTLRPTFLVVVPRVLQKISAAAGAKASARGLSRVWDAAVRTARAWADRQERVDAGGTVPRNVGLGIRHAFFDRLFFARLRGVMGGRVDYILSGGAFLDPELSLFFRGMGVPVIEGYGLTETTAPLTGNLPGRTRSGTVGLPLPGSTVRISADGEVLAGGVGVFSGYRNPAHDADAFVDGFFRTGDLGHLDDAGRLVLGGRLKDVIVTSHGKTIAPAHWENSVEASPLVSHAVVVGESRPYLSALLVLDAQACDAWAKTRGAVLDTGSELVEIDDAPLRAELQSIIDRANAVVSRAEQIKRFAMVFADPDDRTLITPTMKLKRRVAIDKASDAVAALYR
ncbi:AMP-dependent synthetase/ligase [Planococcus sp. APC 4015]|nr:AMP-dependent synthetase/ligase [Planococcus sp. APC 4015]